MHASEAQHRLGLILARHLAAANVLGRMQLVREVHKRTGHKVEIATSSRVHYAEDDSSTVNVGYSFDVPADRPADYLRNLTAVTPDVFDGLTAQYRAQAFTLAGVADQRLIEKVRDGLADVAKQGGSRADFEKAAHKLTSAAGVADLNSFTLDNTFSNAMHRAYSLGRYEQMSEPVVKHLLPIWQYWTVGDDRVRPEHRVLHRFAARADDAVWHKIYPPNGYGCRCSVIPQILNEAPKNAEEPGFERLPMLAQLLVPQPGFGKVFS